MPSGGLTIIDPDPTTRRALVELVLILTRGTAEDVVRDVTTRIEQLDRPCVTAGCDHGLRFGNVCKGYYTCGTIIGVEGVALSLRTSVLNPLVQPFFCDVFSQVQDLTKSRCKDCTGNGYSLRGNFDGVFCHGCGLFIDFKRRRLGYAEEWTTKSNLEAESPLRLLECKNCGSTPVNAKFGDYAFCSKQCLQEWYFSYVRPNPTVLSGT